MTKKTQTTTDYNEYLIDSLKNPDEAVAYLQAALEEYETDDDVEAFLLALRNVVEAKGGISVLAEKTSLNRQNLYKILSDKGNPRLQSLSCILKALGFHLSIVSNIDRAA